MLSSLLSAILYLATFPFTQPLPPSAAQSREGRGIGKHPYPPPSSPQSTLASLVNQGRKVQVDLGVMSRCPDARLCEAVMDDVFKQPGIREKVNNTLNYIGTSHKHAKPYGVTCKHGSLECAGNIHQLCIQSHHPTLSYHFVTTQNYLSPSRIGEIEYAKECLKAVGGDWEDGVEECVQGHGKKWEGRRLLKESVERMKDWGVTKSCTILVEERVRCIHDGEWYDCDEGHEVHDFVKTIEKEWKRLQ